MACVSSSAIAGGDMQDVEPAIEPVIEVPAAEKNFYVGLGFSAVSTGQGGIDFFDNHERRDRTGNLLVLAGYEFNPYVALEGRYSFYIWDEDSTNTDIWGIFVKPQYPVTEDLKVYALAGFGGINVDGANGHDIDVDDTGFQWGAGASYGMTEDIAVFLDYANIANGMSGTWNGTTQDIDADTLTLGLTYKF